MTGDDRAHNAQSMARHAKAALMHLRRAEDAAELAGVDILGENEAARLIRAAGEAVEDLDGWAINNLPGRDARLNAYSHTERWCQAEGGQLPADSWPREADAEAGR